MPETVPRTLRNNAQYIFYAICTLLRNVWGWEQGEITHEKDILITVLYIDV
jgi:hypothetical protein